MAEENNQPTDQSNQLTNQSDFGVFDMEMDFEAPAPINMEDVFDTTDFF